MKRYRLFILLVIVAVLLPIGHSLAQSQGVEVALIPGKCTFCEGSKDCQDCYPAGWGFPPAVITVRKWRTRGSAGAFHKVSCP